MSGRLRFPVRATWPIRPVSRGRRWASAPRRAPLSAWMTSSRWCNRAGDADVVVAESVSSCSVILVGLRRIERAMASREMRLSRLRWRALVRSFWKRRAFSMACWLRWRGRGGARDGLHRRRDRGRSRCRALNGLVIGDERHSAEGAEVRMVQRQLGFISEISRMRTRLALNPFSLPAPSAECRSSPMTRPLERSASTRPRSRLR